MASINVDSYSTLSSRTGTAGLISQLNTEDIIEAYTATTRGKITKCLQDKQVATWTRDAYRTISAGLNDFYNKYFSYSSDTCILSAKYFNTSTITSTSDYVTATGDSDAVANMIIKNISQLASTASTTSTHKVTNQKMQSGDIADSWVNNTIAGRSMNISYGGASYTLTVSSGLYLNSNATDSENINAVIKDLNAQIEKNSSLKGKLAFNLDGNTVKLTQTGSSTTSDLYIKSGDANLLTGLGMYAGTTGSTEVSGTDDYRSSAFFQSNIFAGNALTLNIDGTSYSLSLASDFRFSNAAMEKGSDGNFTAGALALQKSELQSAYETAINNNSKLNGKLTVSIDDDMKMTLTAADASTLKVTAGSAKLLTGLGLSVSDDTQTSNTITGAAMDVKAALEDTKKLGNVLAGTTLTFSLNGVSKAISFNESDKESFDTLSELATYMQDALNTSFGAGGIFVSTDGSKLSFSTVQTDAEGNVTAGDASYILSVTASSASGILTQNGALHMVAGESNRMEKVKTIDQIKGDLATALTADSDGKYKISVNGKTFEFEGSTLVGDIISKINRDEDAGVTITYSSVTDTFSIVADETGAQGKIEFSDVGTSNLASVLFGTKGSSTDGYTVKDGTNLVMNMSFDGGSTYTQVTRSTNSFDIDGVTFNVKNVTAALSETNIQFTADKNVDALYDKIKSFVDDYNAIMTTLNKEVTQTRYGEDADSNDKYLPLTDEQKENMSDSEIEAWEAKAKTGLLSNDQTLISIMNKMRRAMNDIVSGSNSALYKIGITTTSSWEDGGLLEINESTLKAALTKDSSGVVQMFTGTDTSIAYRLRDVVKSAAVGSGSTLYSIAGSSGSSTDKSRYTTMINDYTDKLDNLKKLLATEEDRWWAKFSALEQALSVLNSQSEYLSSFFSSSSS